MICPSEHDRLRCAALHAHADLRAAGQMLRRLRWIAAWKKLRQGYDRLDKALDTRRALADGKAGVRVE